MSIETLQKYIESPNIADLLEDEKLLEIAHEAVKGYEEDRQSMSSFLDKANKIMDLVQLQAGTKNYPFENAANIKFPLITLATVQFASRTLPEIIKNSKLVRSKVIGKDPQGEKFRRGQRASAFLNYKLLDESSTFLEQADKLFHQVATLGTVFKKTYRDLIKNRVESNLVPYDRIIVNNNISALEDAPRISHIVEISKNDIVTGQRKGFYSDVDLDEFTAGENDPGWQDMPEFIEQHTKLDLDNDGYKEPYLVLIHPSSMKILRIRANFTESDIEVSESNEVAHITAQEFFTDYHLMPNPDGSFFSLGFGTLLMSTNETVNTLFNQLVDSGKLANMQGGIIGKSTRLKKRNLKLEPGEWIQAETAMGGSLRDQIYPINYKEPSLVLFQLLQYLVNAAQELTSTTDALTGDIQTQNTSPATLTAAIKQSMQVFTTIQKRMFRSMKKEFRKIHHLYAAWTDLEEYLNVLDPSQEELPEIVGPNGEIADLNLTLADITPVADFNSATSTEKLLRTNTLIQLAIQSGGLINMEAVMRDAIEGLGVEDPDKYLVQAQPKMDPKVVEMQQKAQQKQQELNLKRAETLLRAKEVDLKEIETKSKALKDIASAEAAEVGTQMDVYKSILDSVVTEVENGQPGIDNSGTTN